MNTQAKPQIAVLYAKGTNCHEETVWAITVAGGHGEILLLTDLLSGKRKLTEFQAVIIPGGFSWGDHIAAGRVQAIHMVFCLRDQLQEMVAQKRPIMGICNGFQVLTETGLLSKNKIGIPDVVLRQNYSARFEHRLVRLRFRDTNSFWTKGLVDEMLIMPVAHAEGRFHIPSAANIPFVTACEYAAKNEGDIIRYPDNPNASLWNIAGITDPSGLIFGMMPHPERAIEKWHTSQDGLLLFTNLVSYLLEC